MSAVEVTAYVSGRGADSGAPAVILSNSLGATAGMWDPQLAALEDHFRVIRYETRGHGTSPAPAGPYDIDDLADDLLGVLDRHDIARAHVVGLSLGGATGLRVAQRAPERVAKLVVMCTAAQFVPASAWTDRAASVRAEGLRGIAENSMERWFTPRFVADTDVSRYVEMIASGDAEGYAGCCEALATMDLRADLSAITAPVLALAGAEDQATPPSRLQLIAEGVPGASMVTVPDAAHLANLEQPRSVTDRLLEFLAPVAEPATGSTFEKENA